MSAPRLNRPLIHLETDRLLLRGWREADLEPFAALNGDATVMEHYPAILSRARSDGFAERIQQGLDDDRFGLYAVELKSTGSFAGYVGLAKAGFPAGFTPAVEIGWRLARHS